MDHTTPTVADAVRSRGAEFAAVLIEGAELTDSLREVGEWLERTWHRHLDMPRPTWTSYYRPDEHNWRPSLSFYAPDRATFEATVRALADGAAKGSVHKDVYSHDDEHIEASRMFGSVRVRVWTRRTNVCARRVVGTETVEVPDPEAPLVTIEREVVEWDCAPVLAGGE
jgi:hypothetical protein